MPPMTPQQFVQNWQNTALKERQSYQIHFMELCDLVEHERPTGSGIDTAGKTFAFEYGLKKDSGGQGFADVFYDGHFAIEYKAAGKYKDLTEAYQQLLQYRERLNNPPLLIVTDIANWEIHTNFPNTEKKVYSFSNADIANKRPTVKLLQDIFEAPERLHPDRNTAQVTTDAAEVFRFISDDMRRELALNTPLPQQSKQMLPSPSPSTLRVEGNEDKVVFTRTTLEIWDKIKPFARQMRHDPTPAENALWQQLRRKNVGEYKFRRQHPIDRFIVDFFCAEARLVIEVDGAVHDYTQEEDAIRTEFLESRGLRVIRFSNDEVLQDIDSVLERIKESLQSPLPPASSPLNPLSANAPLPPTPSPLRSEGEQSPSTRSGEGLGEGRSSTDAEMNERIAHFLTKLVFCLFAEDVSLLPTAPNSAKGIFAEIVERTYREPSRFVQYAHDLFKAMANGGDVLFQKIPYFNGSLFDDVQVEQVSTEALGKLLDAAKLNWESVEPAIFGTLFERSLDPSKRAQLGAHYTSRDDILLIVEPVLMQPLRREWKTLQAQAAPIRAQLDAATTPRDRIKFSRELENLRETMLHRLREIKVLDPACGSGNFLYVSLQLLMDLEKEVITDPLFAGLTMPIPAVHPRQMYGIEINPIAHDLATIVVWIGYIQWRQNNGYAKTFGEPILQDLHDNIRQMDAIMNADGTEPEWPEVDVIVGNPPFLGGWRLRGELGEEYIDKLFRLYESRVPAPADFVCYWFEKARTHLADGKVQRAGLLSTNSIRGGSNREVLKSIKETGDIFMAWSDREWVLEGAAVRVSMVGFDKSREIEKTLDGKKVSTINADLTAGIDIIYAKRLPENSDICLRGDEKQGAFDISAELAETMIKTTNKSGRSNTDVVKPYINARDIVQTASNTWIIDFFDMSESEAQEYELPYQHVLTYVKPVRAKNNRDRRRIYWWQHGEIIPNMRRAVTRMPRYMVSPRVGKHRVFTWLEGGIIPDCQLVVITRDDDYFFGVLQSRFHELWALRLGTSLGPTPRYTSTTTFETFPFPWSPGHEDTTSPAYQAVAAAAKQLHEERQAWLTPNSTPPPTPPQNTGRGVKDRTLTNLYNALNVLKGVETMKVKADAAAFAPRLRELHNTLDRAVCDAYGWPHDILDNDDEILRRLLELNLQRAESNT